MLLSSARRFTVNFRHYGSLVSSISRPRIRSSNFLRDSKRKSNFRLIGKIRIRWLARIRPILLSKTWLPHLKNSKTFRLSSNQQWEQQSSRRFKESRTNSSTNHTRQKLST
jgi:hypothetical protein